MAKQVKNKKQVSKKVLLVIQSIAWLIEASFRAFVGWVLLTNFHNYFTTAAAIYALITAGIIVVTHFVKASK